MTDHIFGDVVLETTAAERRRRKLTLLATIAGEALVVATLVAIPLLYLDAVPGISVHAAPTFNTPLSPAPRGREDAPHRPEGGAGQHGANLPALPVDRQFPSLPYGPARPQSGGDEMAGDTNAPPSWGCPGCPPSGTGTDFIAMPPRPVAGPPPRPRISNLQVGMVLRRVDPV